MARVFPEAAWRDSFADYRAAMARATEACDAFHFAALWARFAVALGRRINFPAGMKLFPNVYFVCFGATGDRKTTAMRLGTEFGSSFKIVRGGGSGEGLADEFSSAQPRQGFLLFAEEFSQILRAGRWDGATLIPFLTQCFDCPPVYEMKFRKKPVRLEEPTPSLLAGTTADWFWQDSRRSDFLGGFCNRLFFFTGSPKPAMPLPEYPEIGAIASAVDALSGIEPCQVRFNSKAKALWVTFYQDWRGEESRRDRDPLLVAAVKRIPDYILKLAMVYAAVERTLPEILPDQLCAAILVGRYGVDSAAELLSLQNAGTNPRKELERRIIAYVAARGTTTKHYVYKALHRHYADAETFNRAFESLVRAGELFTKSAPYGRVWVSTSPEDLQAYQAWTGGQTSS